jgi:hypothetical protein
MSVLGKHMHNAPAFFGRSPEKKAKRRAEKLRKKNSKNIQIENIGLFDKKKSKKIKKDFKYQV